MRWFSAIGERATRALIGCGVMAALAGCALFEEPPAAPPRPPAPPQASLPPVQVAPVVPRPQRKPAAPAAAARTEPPVARQSAEPLPAPPQGQALPQPYPPEPVVDPDRLIGMDQATAQSWLGPPRQRAEAAPAVIWRYVTGDCEVDVYFYLDLQSTIMRALHYEVRSNAGTEPRRERCFQQLIAERSARG